MAVVDTIGTAGFGPDSGGASTDTRIGRMSEVQALIDQGESQENVARYISGHPDFTAEERTLARVVLARAARLRHPLGV